MREKVEKALEKIRPILVSDGGNIELIDITEDGVVKIRLTGACRGCPMAGITLKQIIERVLKEEVPQIREVEAI